MATSIGGAAAAGLESGFGMGMRALDQQEQTRARRRREDLETEELAERRADRGLQRARLEAQDKRLDDQDDRQRKQDDRQRRMDELKLLDSEITDLGNEGGTLFQQYGGYDKVPEDVRGDYTTRVRTARERRAAARRSFYEPDIAEQQRDAAEKWSRIQVGQLSVDDLSDDDLVRTLTVQTRRDLADFIDGPDGTPSPIRQAGLDLQAGLETDNLDLTLKAANVLLAPELRTGVGAPGRDGNEIVSKEIVNLVPHPEDPGQMVPIVKVTLRREDGAMGSYVAPITENRSSDPDDNVKTISMQDAFDRVGQLTTLSEALNRPDMRKRIEAGGKAGKAGGDEFLRALSSIGVKPPQKQVSRSTVDLGDRVLERETDAAGNVIGERELRKGAPPRRPGLGGSTETGAKERGIAAALARGDISEQEAKDARRRLALGMRPADEAKAAKANEKERAKRNAAVQQADRLVSTVDGALKNVSGWTAGVGSVLARVPGSDARNLESDLETIKANLGFAELQAMREASPTGGALGAIAVQELVALQSTVASLDARQSPDKLKASLQKIRDHYAAWRDAVTKAGEEEGGEGGGAVPAGASGDWDEEPARVQTDDDYEALPSGATFVAPDGTMRRKP